MRPEPHRPRSAALAAIALLLPVSLLTGCPEASSPDSGRPKNAEEWYRRAQREFKVADFGEAHDSVKKALAIVPEDPEVRALAAEVAIASLDYAEVLRLLKGVHNTDAARLRGRAYWYKGDLEAAADELDTMLNDPEVKDEWAKATTKLARLGLGRTPFSLSGGMLAAVEMVHVSPDPWFVVPVEIDGESALAVIASNMAEVVIDAAARPEPSWVSLKFGDNFEVKDVPALSQDLSGLAKELHLDHLRALIGVNLLRHVNATMDYSGRQFVVRNFAPPPPPSATRIDLYYVRGGGLVVRGTLGGGEHGAPVALMVDTSKPFPIALDLEGWKKAGIDATQLKLIPGDPEQKLREGTVPLLRLGAFDIPRVSGYYGVSFTELEKAMQVDLDGILGAGVLADYRCTFADGGRLLWLEDDAEMQRVLSPSGPAAPPAPSPSNQTQLPGIDSPPPARAPTPPGPTPPTVAPPPKR